MARWLIIAGVILIAVGLAWPLLAKLGLGRLPGDIHIERDGYSFYFPITTGLIVSIVLSLLFWLLRKLRHDPERACPGGTWLTRRRGSPRTAGRAPALGPASAGSR